MPITQSAKKALRQNKGRHADNLAKMKAVKQVIKILKASPSAEKLSAVYQKLDKAAKTHVIPRNKASRLKSQMARLLVNTGAKK